MNLIQASQAYFPFPPAPAATGSGEMPCSGSIGDAPTPLSAPVSCSLIQDTYTGSTASPGGNLGCSCMATNNLLDWSLGGEGVVA